VSRETRAAVVLLVILGVGLLGACLVNLIDRGVL
jgi:hypothetical protein